jgi:hypothetical protein
MMKLGNRTVALALGGALAVGTAQGANSFFNTGDLVLYFQEEGGSNTVYVGLGNAATLYRGSAGGPTADRQALNITNINATLTSAFGAGWASNTNIYAGLAGVRSNSTNTTSTAPVVNGDMARTIYISRARLGVGTIGSANSDAWDTTTYGQPTGAANGILGQNNIFADTAGTNGYDAVSVVSPTGISTIDNQNPFLTTDIQGTAFGYFPGGVQQVGGASSFGTFGDAGEVEFALDLYRFLPVESSSLSAGMQAVVVPGGKVASYEGTITIGTDGAVSFVTVPEPSSVLLTGVAALGLLARRRRNA